MSKSVISILLAIAICLSVCVGAQEDEGIISFTGRVQHYSYEGGFYGIADEEGTVYKPVKLPSSFKIEGLRVRVKARPVEKKLLTSGWGVPIEIITIKRRKRR